MLTHSAFDVAVRDALRRYARADLLVGNALLQSLLLGRSAPGGATPEALKSLLTQTSETLFANGRDERVHRVLSLTYFASAPKQEAIAERLGMSFSTYRRRLAAGTDRMVDWLWRQEQALREAKDGTSQISTPRPVDSNSAPSLVSRPRLSIVILPFLNLSPGASADYLVDGIVDSLITDLSSRLPGSFVISRSTAFTFKGRAVPIRQVGEELGVRYVLEGSVFVELGRIRINVQLIDATTDEHLWAERFDKDRKEILLVQDEIVGRLSRSIGIQLVRTEARSGSANSDAWDIVDLVMRARALITDVKRKETAVEAIDLLREALRLDPDCISCNN